MCRTPYPETTSCKSPSWGGKKDPSWQGSIIRCPRHWSYLRCLSPFIYSSIAWIPPNESRHWSFSLFPSTIFLRIGTFLDRTIPGFPPKPVGLSLHVRLGLAVCDSLLGSSQRTFQKNKRKEKQAMTSSLSTVQTDFSMFRMYNAAHCTLFVYLNPGPRLPRLCHHLFQTAPGSNQAISTACCHSLSSSFHNSHIRFPFYRDWYDKTHNGQDRHQKM